MRLVGLLALPVLATLLTACGDATDVGPMPASIVQYAPARTTAQAQRPFSFEEYDPSWTGRPGVCFWTGKGDGQTLEATAFTVSEPVTIDAITAQSTGVIWGTPVYTVLPDTVNGHKDVFGGGAWLGSRPTSSKEGPDLAAASGWAQRQAFIGATLSPGVRYMLFQPTDVPSGTGVAWQFTIAGHGSDGTASTSVWRDARQWSPGRC